MTKFNLLISEIKINHSMKTDTAMSKRMYTVKSHLEPFYTKQQQTSLRGDNIRNVVTMQYFPLLVLTDDITRLQTATNT